MHPFAFHRAFLKRMPHPTPTAESTNGRTAAVAHEIRRVFDAQQAYQQTARNAGAEQRAAKIQRIHDVVMELRQEIRDALHADFRKAPQEVDLSEIKITAEFAKHAQAHVAEWMAPEKVRTPPTFLGTTSEIHYEPKGVVLIISPWNYPFNLTLGPLISALAAGNCAILKPSEYTPHSSRLLRTIVEELFDEREVALFEGDKTVAQELLKHPFDHFYFTGSPPVGRIVMKAAAEHLSSVTLELGGKSPTIVDDTANIKDAARKIAWGKFTNAGQTCIAPDYIYVHERVHDDLVEALQQSIHKFYGATDRAQRTSDDYARLVNAKHFQRVRQLLDAAIEDGAHVAVGGTVDAGDRYIAPTLLTDVPLDTGVMEEEIFGPVLPILKFRTLDEALDRITARPNPLTLYLFTRSEATEQQVLQHTKAGNTCINDTMINYFNPNLPFGGAGHSGIGKSHGVFGFKEFSNERAVLRRAAGSAIMRAVYPPYKLTTRKVIDWLVKYL